MKATIFLILLQFLFTVSALAFQQTDTIGRIQTMQGTVFIQRGANVLPAKIGFSLYNGDLVRTAKPGAAGIVLIDDTTVSLGPNSELSLKEYAFEPKDGKFALAMRMFKGTFVYLSGQIGKLAPDTVKLIIPDATIAIRGTKLLIEVQE